MNPAELYETYFVPGMFRPLSRIVLSFAAVREGERVLDLACGTGVIARQLAPVVGDRGRVVALDLRPGMLEAASKLTVPYGAPIEWVEGDATKLGHAASAFDLIICQQGLQFFGDKPAAVAEMKRVLAPGGRVVIATWDALQEQTMWHEVIAVEIGHFEKLGLPTSDVVAPFSLNDAGELRGLLEGAGLRDVVVERRTIETDFPSQGLIELSLRAYTAVMPQIASDPAAFRAFADAVVRDTADILARYAQDGRVSFTMQTLIATARA